VQLRVTDNGIGIPEENQRSILDFGFSTRRERGAQGIGLWFCQLYVFQLGGKLTFESEAGKGSWFGIDFPAMEA
jgi:sensor histidine kinase regulating citrate/malate metabolism